MDILATVAILNCFVSPVLAIAAFWFLYLYFKKNADSGRKIKRLENRIASISRTSMNAVREGWFEEIKALEYASELEVESKFVYPMMRYLGYGPKDLRMRIDVTVRVGRADIKGISDWVVFQNEIPKIVIEAKAEGQWLDSQVQEQARSYCFAMNAPMYILANGKEIKLYVRSVEKDQLVFQSQAAELSQKWGELYELIGVST